MQKYESASHYCRPYFNDGEKPFRDVRDFQWIFGYQGRLVTHHV